MNLLKLKAVSKKTNELPTSIIDIDGKIGGYSTFASSYVPQGTMYAVNPQACWSNIAYVGLISDEFTLAHKGQNRVCKRQKNAYFGLITSFPFHS